MSLLEIRVGAGVLALLALLTLRRQRWAYYALVVLGLAYFPAQAHFHVALHLPKCEQLITKGLVLLSLQDYVHIALFAGFYWISWVQFRQTDARILWAFLATLVVGALLEVVEGMSMPARRGAVLHCRVQDLVPVVAGALGAALLLAIWSRLTRKPGYVRLVRKGQAAASSKARAAVPPPPPPRPLYGLPTVSTDRVVPPPADFAPMPPSPAPAPEPTEEVAPVRQRFTKEDIVQRLRAIPQRLRAIRLGAIPQHLLALLQGLWGIIRARRRAIIIGVVVLVLVGGGAFVLLQVLPAPPPPAVTVQPEPPPPPPPPRPLQVEVPGYYEPDYKFVVADRRFIRLTLKPDASLTFAKYAGREESGCADARITQTAVYVRCEVARVGIVTIDGRFASRFATSRLDAGVLSATITVKNPRGEVLYRARDSFRYHEPD